MAWEDFPQNFRGTAYTLGAGLATYITDLGIDYVASSVLDPGFSGTTADHARETIADAIKFLAPAITAAKTTEGGYRNVLVGLLTAGYLDGITGHGLKSWNMDSGMIQRTRDAISELLLRDPGTKAVFKLGSFFGGMKLSDIVSRNASRRGNE